MKFSQFFAAKKPTLGISFSGGGAKAFVYLGVLKALEENKINIDLLAGLSGGALVAGLYAYGMKIEQIVEVAYHLRFLSLFDTNPFNGIEIMDHSKVLATLKGYVGDARIEHLPKPLIVMATDIDHKKPVAITTGELASALVASSAFPLLMDPVQREGRSLIDGGFSVKYGTKFLREHGADRVVGVNIDPVQLAENIPNPFRNGVRSVLLLMELCNNYEQEQYPTDLEIGNFDTDIGFLGFTQMNESAITAGYQRTLEFIPQLKQLSGEN